MGLDESVYSVGYSRIERIGDGEERILAIGANLESTSGDFSGKVPVFLNVYDLTPLNGYSYWLGIGIFHSGIEVHGVEYAYGAHDYPTTGVFEMDPRNCPGFVYRKTILLGTTDLNPYEFRDFIEQLAGNYNGDSYHLLLKNCNHFSNDVSMRVTGNPIPSWVNRLARIGLVCHCLIPDSLQIAAGSKSIENEYCEEVSAEK